MEESERGCRERAEREIAYIYRGMELVERNKNKEGGRFGETEGKTKETILCICECHITYNLSFTIICIMSFKKI